MSHYNGATWGQSGPDAEDTPRWQRRGCTCNSASSGPCRYCDWRDTQREAQEDAERERVALAALEPGDE